MASPTPTSIQPLAMTKNETQENASKASLGQMPAELKHAIFKELEKDDHMALCTVSKAVRPSAIALLYESFDNGDDEFLLPRTKNCSRLSQLIWALSKNPELALSLKQLRLIKSTVKEPMTKEELQYCSQVLTTSYRTDATNSDVRSNRERSAVLQFLNRGLREGDSRAKVAVLLLAAKNVEYIAISVDWLTDSSNGVDNSKQRELDVIARVLIGLHPDDGAGQFEKLRAVHIHVVGGHGHAGSLWQHAQKTCRMPTVEHMSLSVSADDQKNYAAESIQPSASLESLTLVTPIADHNYLKCALRLSQHLRSFEMQWGEMNYGGIPPPDVVQALSHHKHTLTTLKLTARPNFKSECSPITPLRDFAHLRNLKIDIDFLTTGYNRVDLWKSGDTLERSLADLLPLGLERLMLCTKKHMHNYVEIFGRVVLAIAQALKELKVKFDVDERLRASEYARVSVLATTAQIYGSSITTIHFDLNINLPAHTIVVDLRHCATTMEWIKENHRVVEANPDSPELEAASTNAGKYHASSRVRDFIEASEIRDEMHEFWGRMVALKLPRYQ